MSTPSGSGEAFEFPGRAPGVLLLHGFTGTPWEVRPVGEALRDAGFACRAPLLPGHGTSPRDLARLRWDDSSGAARAEARAWMNAHGSVVLLGMSMGALLALDAALDLGASGPAGPSGVVTLGCALQLRPAAATALLAARALGDRLPDADQPKPSGGSDVRDAAMRALNPGYRVNPIRAAREILVGQERVRPRLPLLEAPLLALHGLLDRTIPLAASLELVGRAGSTDSALVVLPRSGHLIAVDHDRSEVARQVVSFVRRLAGE